MNHLFLPEPQQINSPDAVIKKINVLNGIYYGLLMVGLFILAKSSGLPDNWSFLSCLIAFLFFGTNRFSYFSYYSLSPSALSLLIYWLWVSFFFFKKKPNTILAGVTLSLIIIPFIVVNHIQEAIFLGFISLLWVFLNLSELIFQSGNKLSANRGLKFTYIILLFCILWLLPQFELVQDTLSRFFIFNDWKKNQEIVYSWNGIHLFGKIWELRYRVMDTLGIMGFFPVILGVIILWPGLIEDKFKKKNRIVILGIVPLIVYLIPLFHFIWLSNCQWTSNYIRYYYRFCYSSIYWITIAYFLYGIRNSVYKMVSKFYLRTRGKTKYLLGDAYGKYYFSFCMLLILLLSCFRSFPVYGKLDFLTLESKPWWSAWQQMIHDVVKDKKTPVVSDRATVSILNGVFNVPIAEKFLSKIERGNLDIHRISKVCERKPCRLIVNLKTFEPSWVPGETHHWSHDYVNPLLSYRYKKKTGKKLLQVLKNKSGNYHLYY